MTETLEPIPNFGAMMRFDGKVFVIIGAGEGVGRQMAHALTQFGAKVACVGRSEAKTRAVAEEVGGVACLGDATKSADVERIFAEAIAAYGAVHGVIDTLGEWRRSSFAECDDDKLDWHFNINVRHAVHVLRVAGPLIAAAGGGSITFVSSIAGEIAVDQALAYGMAKAALKHVVKQGAAEFGPRNVRVNAVAPTYFMTPRLERLPGTQERLDKYKTVHPLGRIVTTVDVAGPLFFLATELASEVTGQVVIVDGGVLAHLQLPK